jgi:hypothetical protein
MDGDAGRAALAGRTGAGARPVDLEQYLKRDGYGRIKISPDGRYYAATVDLAIAAGW